MAATSAPEIASAHRDLLSSGRLGEALSGAAEESQILLPVDDSDDAERALEYAISLFPTGHVFHLLNVVPEPQMVHVWAGVYIPPDDDAELLEVEDAKLMATHRFAKKLLTAKIPFHLHVIVGPTDSDSVSRIVQHKAANMGAKCIVVAKHSKGKLQEMWVGSVTKSLISRPPANVPIIVVPHK